LRNGGLTSVQVLNEFVRVARQKLRHDWPQIELALSLFRASLDEIVPITLRQPTRVRSRSHATMAYTFMML